MENFNDGKQRMLAVNPSTPALKPNKLEQVTYNEKQEILKAAGKMNDKQLQKLIDIITQNCAWYRDMEQLEIEIDDLPCGVQIMLVECVRSFFGNSNNEPGTSAKSNPGLINLTGEDGRQESQGSGQLNTLTLRRDGAMSGVAHALLPPNWIKAPLPPLRDEPL